jgi:hypothetical protein
MIPREPNGPDLHKKILTHKPTTTGGKPIPKLARLTRKLRPGNLLKAKMHPRGTPIMTLIKVAIPDTLRVNQQTSKTSGSKLTRISKALTRPSHISSNENHSIYCFNELFAQVSFVLSGIRIKQRLPVGVHPKL